MLYLTSDINQYEGEGVGSRIQSSIACELMANYLGINFYETELSNLYHRPEHLTDSEFCKSLNDIFFKGNKSIEFDEIVDINIPIAPAGFDSLRDISEEWKDRDTNNLFRIGLNEAGNFLTRSEILAKKTDLSRIKLKSLSDKVVVAIHMRVYNKFDTDWTHLRNYYIQETYMERYYINIIKQLEESIGKDNIEFHIHTQEGFMDESKTKPINFDNIKNENVKFYIDSPLDETILHLVNSDILVMSCSSMSYICYLLRKKISIVRSDFWFKTTDDCFRLNNSGDMDKTMMEKIINENS